MSLKLLGMFCIENNRKTGGNRHFWCLMQKKEPKGCQNPISWTYYVTSTLWQYSGMVFEFPDITWGLSGGHLEDQFGRFLPFSTFFEAYRPDCHLKCCQKPISPIHYVTSDLRQYFGMVFELPDIA